MARDPARRQSGPSAKRPDAMAWDSVPPVGEGPASAGLLGACGRHLEVLARLVQQGAAVEGGLGAEGGEADEAGRDLARALEASAATLSRQLWQPPAASCCQAGAALAPTPTPALPPPAAPGATAAAARLPATEEHDGERKESSTEAAVKAYKCVGGPDPAAEVMIRRKSSEREMWNEDQIMLRELQKKKSSSKHITSLEQELDGHLPSDTSRIYRVLRKVVGNPGYETFWAVIVLLNTAAMVVEDEYIGMKRGHQLGVYSYYGSAEYSEGYWPHAGVSLIVIDILFATLFSIEVLLVIAYDLWTMKLGASCHFRVPFWREPWDIFDLVVVITSNAAVIMQIKGPLHKVRFIRILRLIKLLRLSGLVRQYHVLDPLHLMVTAIRASLGSLLFSTMLLVLTLTLFAMFFCQYFRFMYLREDSPLTDHMSLDVKRQLFQYFGTYTRSMLSLFELTLANWPTITRFLLENVHEVFGTVCVCIKLSVGVAVIGVINGVFIQETFSTATNDSFIMVRKRMKQTKDQRERVSRFFNMANENADGFLERHELVHALEKRGLRIWLDAMDVKCADGGLLFDLIAGHKDEISEEDFITGIGRLKGPARNIDLLNVQHILRWHTDQEQQRQDREACQEALRDSGPTASGPLF